MEKYFNQHKTKHQQTGVVLLVGLIFLAILTVVTAFTFRGANSGFLMSGNNSRATNAIQAAESGLMAVVNSEDPAVPRDNLFRQFCFDRDLTGVTLRQAIDLPGYLTFLTTPSELFNNSPAESMVNNVLDVDFRYQLGGMRADIRVYAGDRANNPGSNLAQQKGSLGDGHSSPGGSIQITFDIRSTGRSASTTAVSDLTGFYRYIIQGC